MSTRYEGGKAVSKSEVRRKISTGYYRDEKKRRQIERAKAKGITYTYEGQDVTGTVDTRTGGQAVSDLAKTGSTLPVDIQQRAEQQRAAQDKQAMRDYMAAGYHRSTTQPYEQTYTRTGSLGGQQLLGMAGIQRDVLYPESRYAEARPMFGSKEPYARETPKLQRPELAYKIPYPSAREAVMGEKERARAALIGTQRAVLSGAGISGVGTPYYLKTKTADKGIWFPAKKEGKIGTAIKKSERYFERKAIEQYGEKARYKPFGAIPFYNIYQRKFGGKTKQEDYINATTYLREKSRENFYGRPSMLKAAKAAGYGYAEMTVGFVGWGVENPKKFAAVGGAMASFAPFAGYAARAFTPSTYARAVGTKAGRTALLAAESVGFGTYGALSAEPGDKLRSAFVLGSMPIAFKIGGKVAEYPKKAALEIPRTTTVERYTGGRYKEGKFIEVKKSPVKTRGDFVDTYELYGIQTPKGRGGTLLSRVPESMRGTFDLGYRLGSPKIDLSGIKPDANIKLGTSMETKALSKAVKTEALNFEKAFTPTKAEAQALSRAKGVIKPASQSLGYAFDVKSAFDFGFPTKTPFLEQRGYKAVMDTGVRGGGTTFGGNVRQKFASKDYVYGNKKYKLDYETKDIDMRFDFLSQEGVQPLTNKAIEKLQRLGYEARPSPEIQGAGEVKVGGKWEKAFEYKGYDSSDVPDYVLGFKKVGKLEYSEGRLHTGLSEEIRGTMQGLMNIRKTKRVIDIFPEPKRVKDVSSTSTQLRTARQSLEEQGGFFKKRKEKKLGKAIEEFESFYPEKLVKAKVKPADTFKTFAEIKSPSPSLGKTTSKFVVFGSSKSSVSRSSDSFKPITSSISPSKSPSKSSSSFSSFSPSPSKSPSVSPSSISPSKSPSKSRSSSSSSSSVSSFSSSSVSSSISSFSSYSSSTSRVTTPPPLIMGGGFFKSGYGGRGAKSKTKYTPTATAATFGITGKAPKIRGQKKKGKGLTGLEFRPMKEGFGKTKRSLLNIPKGKKSKRSLYAF